MGASSITRRGLLVGGLAVAASGWVAAPVWAATSPPIIDCGGWGARPNSRAIRVHNRRPVKIIVHHTATPNVADLGRGAADRLARGIQNFHMDRRGWIDSGQHFTISRGGFVLEGRRRSLEALRNGGRQVESAHCTGQNLVSIGIENEGTYLGVGPTGQLWDRLRQLCAYVCQQYGIAPAQIHGHRDFKDTACPGDVLYGMLPRLRGDVAGLLGRRVEQLELQPPTWPLLRVGDRGRVVQAAQYLLRAAGHPEVPVDGRFDEPMAEIVRRFQTERRTEEVNGLIGGESWPLLALPVRAGDDGDAARAVEVLVAGGAAAPPKVIDPEQWQRLLNQVGGFAR